MTYAHARRRPWELLDTLIVRNLKIGKPLLLKRFSEAFFFSKMVPNGLRDGLKNVTKSDANELGTTSTKHVEHVLSLIPLDLQETRF